MFFRLSSPQEQRPSFCFSLSASSVKEADADYKWICLSPRRRAQEQLGITVIVQAVPVLQLAQDLASNIKRHGLMVGGCTI